MQIEDEPDLPQLIPDFEALKDDVWKKAQEADRQRRQQLIDGPDDRAGMNAQDNAMRENAPVRNLMLSDEENKEIDQDEQENKAIDAIKPYSSYVGPDGNLRINLSADQGGRSMMFSDMRQEDPLRWTQAMGGRPSPDESMQVRR